MVYIDLDAPDPSLEAGIHLYRVAKCEEKASQKTGDMMFVLELARVDNSNMRLRSQIMLEGRGRKYGVRKLSALLGTGFKGEITPDSILERKVWVATKVTEYTTKDGSKDFRLEVNDALLRCGGFQPEGEIPDGCALPEDSQPF